MRHLRMFGLCIVAAFAVTAVAAMGASSALASEGPPTVTKVEPASGPTTGGNGVTIIGTGFVEGAKVKIGTTEATAVNVASENKITATAPAASTGEDEVIVEDSNGVSTGGPKYTYLEPEKLAWSWTKMKNCPVHSEINGKRPAHCDYAHTRAKAGGFFTVGGITVPIIKPIILQGGASEEEYEVEGFSGLEILFPPTDGVPPVSKSPEKVPVEVLNNVSEQEMNEFGWPQNLRESYKLAKSKGYFKANKTTELIETAGAASQYVSPFNILVEEGPGILARVQIKGENPWLTLLGGSCQIGSESEPVVQHLQSGESVSPLATEKEREEGAGLYIMHGKPGFASLHFNFEMAALYEQELVDNTYAVPGAKGCGGSTWESYLDPVVNKAFGLPAPAGASQTRLSGQQYTSTRVSAEKHLGL